ncbi:MAG TPA: HAD-IIB family hydrolase [Candidatus Saccharimonadales bacterium]|nr:HAD-IIB family hydrolase [Candidatus Saccharimonadales bacterium]
MSKKVIAFDLDDTLAVTKSAITDRMGDLLGKLLEKYNVCVISGGRFEQFEKQLLDNLYAEPEKLARLHLMPTCGTRYYRFDTKNNKWEQQYSEDLSEEDKELILKTLKEGAKKLGLWPDKPFGDVIEDRGSQITFSGLGQNAPAEEKYKWDPDGAKKHKIRDHVAQLLPHLEVRVGGTTSVDITKVGIDKAYGMKKLMEALDITKQEIFFIGDRLEEGGNDYPVKAAGIDCMQISHANETELAIEAIIGVS